MVQIRVTPKTRNPFTIKALSISGVTWKWHFLNHAHLRHPITYYVESTAKNAERRAVSARLSEEIEQKLRLTIAATKPPLPPPVPFPMAAAKDGPARFRIHGDALGRPEIFLSSASPPSISLATGPAIWLRLMPIVDPGRKWAAHELREQAIRGSFSLAPFVWHALTYIRAADGFGTYAPTLQEPIEAASVAFAFETGEVWAVDTRPLAHTPNHIPHLEQLFIGRLMAYSQFLLGLGLMPPYRWIGGLTGIMDRQLEIPSAPGRMRIAGWGGPQCLSDEVEAEGIYDGQQTPANSLYPLFKAIYDKCGVARPDFLPR